MKITVLSENISENEDLKAEHGLSLYIETENKRILFDTGQSDLFYENAKKLGVDLERIDLLILSHGHYDHTGGVKKFFEINKTAPCYLSKYAFGDYYNGTEKYIGMDKSLQYSERLIFVDDKMTLDEKCTLYSCNNMEKKIDLGSFSLTKKEDGVFKGDDFLHEQYLLIEENGLKILISGCSHKGILNIAHWFKPDVLVGGFHFSKLACYDKLKEYALDLNEYDSLFYTCHCTGYEQFMFMKKYMQKLNYLSVGKTVIIG